MGSRQQLGMKARPSLSHGSKRAALGTQGWALASSLQLPPASKAIPPETGPPGSWRHAWEGLANIVWAIKVCK